MTPQTAVIGAGWFGRAHARVYNDLSDLVAVCDLNQDNLELIKQKYDINTYTDYHEMLKNESLDALSVVTPPSFIPQIALDCVKKGINVLMEKPLGNSIDDLTPLKPYCDSLRIMPGHLELFNPVVDELQNKIHEIGEPIYVASQRIGLYPRRQWGIGVMHDLGYHEIYIQRKLFGEAEITNGLMRRFKNEHEDSALVLMKYPNEVNGLLEANWLTPTKFRQLAVYGSEGKITIDYITQGISIIHADEDGLNRLDHEIHPYRTKEPLMREISAFLNASKNPVTLDDGIATLALTLRAIGSKK